MEQTLNKNNQSYAMRKIPISLSDDNFVFDSENTDIIKILELSNSIDDWEKELLFSENGFYSLKGSNILGKVDEYCEELENFIELKISETKFSSQYVKEIINDIKNKKLNSIKKLMKQYEQEQLKNWEYDVCENSLLKSIERAVLYKNNPDIVVSSFQNGMTILNFLSENENWDHKIFQHKKDQFNSDFYYSLISSFLNDKDINAFKYYDKYKDKIKKEQQDELEKLILYLKENILAYNWLRELLSYGLSDEKNEKEINSIKDKSLKDLINKLFLEHKQEVNQNSKKEKILSNEENWKKIIEILNTVPDKSYLYIDYSFPELTTNLKKKYIKTIREKGAIETQKDKFLKILEDFIKDYNNFIQQGISDYRAFLSEEDFELIADLNSMSGKDYEFFKIEYNYLKKELEKNNIRKDNDIYDVYKMLIISKEKFKLKNKRDPELEEVNKIIKSIMERFTS